MGKNKDGRFVPAKGRPSGDGKSKAEVKVVHVDELEEQNSIEDKYTDGPDTPAANVATRHPNRNVDKDELDNNNY